MRAKKISANSLYVQLCVILEKVTKLNLLSFRTFRIAKMKSAFKLITHLAVHVTFHSSDSLNLL